MSQYRVDFEVAQSGAARSLTGALSEIMLPVADAVTMFEAGPSGHRVSAYYSEQPDLNELRSALEPYLDAGLAKDLQTLMTSTTVPDENWVAISQAALPPVVGGRFTVHGSHDRWRIPRGPNAIEIDAGEAFGTAHHATTLGCLMAIDELTRVRKFKRVLDLGSGSGVLAIAAARALPNARVLASDIDPLAVAVAADNVRRNRLAGGRVKVIVASGLTHPLLRGHSFDLIVANILASPLIQMAKELARISPRCGCLVLSGLLVPQAPEVIAAYRAAGFLLKRHVRLAGWSTLVLVKA